MPNSVDRPDPEFVPGTARSDIVALLYRHPDETLSPSEVAERLDISAEDATSDLVELRNQGIVGLTESGCYHAIDRRGDMRHYVAALDQLERMFNRSDVS